MLQDVVQHSLYTELVNCCACLQRRVTDKGHMVFAREGCILSFFGAGVLATQYEASFLDRQHLHLLDIPEAYDVLLPDQTASYQACSCHKWLEMHH